MSKFGIITVKQGLVIQGNTQARSVKDLIVSLGGVKNSSKNYWFVAVEDPVNVDNIVARLQTINFKSARTTMAMLDDTDESETQDTSSSSDDEEEENIVDPDSSTIEHLDQQQYVITGHDKYGNPIYEHRIVAESVYGPLRPGDEVHHINRIKNDNRPQNLVVLSKRAHRKLHRTAGWHSMCGSSPCFKCGQTGHWSETCVIAGVSKQQWSSKNKKRRSKKWNRTRTAK